MIKLHNLKTSELFDLLTSKLIIDLKDNESLCPDCKGLKVTYRESGGKSYISTCSTCYNGKVYKCSHCGSLSRQEYCYCKQAQDKRSEDFRKKEWDKWQEALKTATIIKFSEYEGCLKSLYNEELVVQSDDYREEYLDQFDIIDSPKMVCASIGEIQMSLDIKDIISERAEDGYDEMYEHLDMESPLLVEAQKLIDKWMEENEGSLKVYCETNKVIVDLSELYEEGVNNNEYQRI